MGEFNLNNFFEKAFGYQAPERKPKLDQAPARQQHSNLGQPYYDEDLFGRELFMPVRLNGILVSFAVIGCSWKKTIVSTPLPERGGTVKELICIDDYPINIKGLLVNPDDEWPEAGMIEIYNTFKKNESVVIRSAVTDIFLSGKSNDKDDNVSIKKEGDPGGYRVVIREVKWPPVAGVQHVKAFEIDCESDLIFTLEIQ